MNKTVIFVCLVVLFGCSTNNVENTWKHVIKKSGYNLAVVLNKRASLTGKHLIVSISRFKVGGQHSVVCEPLSSQLTGELRGVLTREKNQHDFKFDIVRENDPNKVDIVIIGKWFRAANGKVALSIDAGDVNGDFSLDLGIENVTFDFVSLSENARQCVFDVDPVLRWQHTKKQFFVYDAPTPGSGEIGAIARGQKLWVLGRIRGTQWAIIDQKDKDLPKLRLLGFVYQLLGEKLPITTNDIGALARSIGTQLESNLKQVKDYSVYVRRPVIQGLLRNTLLENYIVHLLQTGVGHSDLFTVKDPKVELKGLSKGVLKARAINSPSRGFQRQSNQEALSLTGQLVQADAELLSHVYAHNNRLEIQLRLINNTGNQLSITSVNISRNLFPQNIILPPEDAVKNNPVIANDLTLKNLQLEVATNRGGQRAIYHRGDEMQLVIKTNQAAYIYLFSISSTGIVTALFPANDRESNHIMPDHPIIIPDDLISDQFIAGPPFGKDTIWVVATASRWPSRVGDWEAMSGKNLKMQFQTKALERDQAYADREVILETRP